MTMIVYSCRERFTWTPCKCPHSQRSA